MGEEVVMLSRVPAAEVNYGYEDLSCLQLLSVGAYSPAGDGSMVTVKSLRHLRDLVAGAVDGRLRFRFDSNTEVVLATAECIESAEDVLRQYAIPKAWSANLESAAPGPAA